ncbi:MAG: hypothetical protein K6G58_11185 [Lachnospiraceae bacterium]|nr:hypothetical protein [Lachnospiraceae bacterium]
MKKKIVMLFLAAALSASLLTACGGDKEPEMAAETEVEEIEETDEDQDDVQEIESEDSDSDEADDDEDDGSFTLLDVDDTMVDVGAYGIDDDGTELVFTMFTGPDGNKYVSLFGFDNNSEDGDVICGQYEATTETDEDGDEWTYFDVEDVYTGNHFNLGVCERPETEEVFFFDEDGNVVPGKFLTASETIGYMGAAVSVIDN